jgi:hypothetical protein
MLKTKRKLVITSDVINRLIKIRNGVIYQDFLNFAEELIQNCQRAKATVVYLTIIDSTFSIEDNGIGCEDPATLLTFDVSGFGVGFGEGFGSVYTVADQFEIHSKNWIATLDIEEAIKKRDLNVDINDDEFYRDGFKVSLKGVKIQDHLYSIKEKVEEVCKNIPNIDFYINGELLPKKDIMDLSEEYKYHTHFSNKIYNSHFALLPNNEYGNIQIFYDYRFVREYSYKGVDGVILLKPNSVTLRSPDRKDIMYDRKRTNFKDRVEKDIRYMLKQLLVDGEVDSISDYAEIIENYLDVESYIKYLKIGEEEVTNQYDTRKNIIDDEEDYETEEENNQMQYNNSSNEKGNLSILEPISYFQEENNNSSIQNTIHVPSLPNGLLNEHNTESSLQKINKRNESTPVNHNDIDTKRIEEDQTFTSFVHSTENQKTIVKNIKEINIKNIKNKRNVVWIEKDKKDEFSHLISQYEYYGIYTFVSPHILYHKSLKFLDIPHISTVADSAIEKNYEVTRIGAISKKEERAMELLSFIESNLGLRKTFYISDIKCKKIVNLRGAKLYQEKMEIEGYQKGNEIHLNRKSLVFGKMNCILLGKSGLSIHDLKFILSNIELISHELAHLIYYTSDNTKEHHEKENIIQKEIGNIIMNCENLF